MSSSRTPAHRVEFTATGGYYTPQAWPAKYIGRPSDTTLARWVEDFEAATREGGVNAFLGETAVWSAQVVHQSTGDVVATYRGPAFAVAA